MHVPRAFVTAGLLLVAAGCDLPPGTPTPPTVTEKFTGTLVAQGSMTYIFTVLTTGTVDVHLSTIEPPATLVGLGVGTPNAASGCRILSASPAASATSAPQITVSEIAGTYCVSVFDSGSVGPSASFTVTVNHS